MFVIRSVCLSGNRSSAVRRLTRQSTPAIGFENVRVAHCMLHILSSLYPIVSQFWLREASDVTQQCEGGGAETGR